MKALILIGGLGTRLRPFTCDVPKPLLPVVNRPLLAYQIEVLHRHGIRDVVLCTSYKPAAFHRWIQGKGARRQRIHCVHEASPLGTGGAIRNAELHITDTTLILNGDLLNVVDIPSFMNFHRKRKADVSIALTPVKDPTQYGLVEMDSSGRIRRFLEKPSWDEITHNTVNAGAYLFEPSVLRFIPSGVPYSLERGLFPQLLESRHRLYGWITKGYWIDIGTVDKYLQVHLDVLGGSAPFRPLGRRIRPGMLAEDGVSLGKDVSHEGMGATVLGKGSQVGPFSRFIGSVSIGERCSIGRGATLENCVVLENVRIGDGARLDRCIIGHDCELGPNSDIGPGRALGPGSRIGRFSQL